MSPTSISYFYNYSKEWGNRSYFTFYGEFHREWNGCGTLEACTLFLVFLASLSANATIIYAIVKHPPLRTVTNYFIVNLAAADIAFALSIPMVAVTRITESWIFGDTVCHVSAYLQLVCGAVLIWSLTIIGIDRYRCIVVPPVRPNLTVRQSVVIVGFVWTVSAAIFVPVLLYFHVMSFELDSKPVQICTLVLPDHHSVQVSAAVIAFWALLVVIVPVIVLAYSYRKIFKKLREAKAKVYQPPADGDVAKSRKSANRLSAASNDSRLSGYSYPTKPRHSGIYFPFAESCPTVAGSGDLGDRPLRCNAQFVRCLQKYKATRILLICAVVVLLMWIPVLCMVFAIFLNSTDNGPNRIQSHDFVCGGLLLAFTNSCLNAVLYGGANKNFQLYFCPSPKCKQAGDDGSNGGENAARRSTCDPMANQDSGDKHRASCSICRMAQESRLASVSISSIPAEEGSFEPSPTTLREIE